MECLLGRKRIFLVAINLQGGQVIELGCELKAFLLLYGSDGERQVFDAVHQRLSLFLGGDGVLAFFDGYLRAKQGIAVVGLEFPIGARNEVLYVCLSLDDQRQRRGLHTSHREHLAVLSTSTRVPYSIRARGVHTEQPVTYCAHQACFVQVLVFRLIFEFLKTVFDGLFGQGVDPETLDGTPTARLLIHPALYQLSFLAGITAVDDLVGLFDQGFDGIELFVHPGVTRHLDGETRRDHRQRAKAPRLPLLGIFLRVQQRA